MTKYLEDVELWCEQMLAPLHWLQSWMAIKDTFNQCKDLLLIIGTENKIDG